MADFIERKDVMAAMARLVPKNRFPAMLNYGDVVDAILQIPSADADWVDRGKWEKFKDDNDNRHYRCSACGQPAPIDRYGYDDTSAFCPTCGAEMDADSMWVPRARGVCSDCANDKTGVFRVWNKNKGCPEWRSDGSCWESKEEAEWSRMMNGSKRWTE